MVVDPRRSRRITWWGTAPASGRSDRLGCVPPIPTGPAGEGPEDAPDRPDGLDVSIRCFSP